MLLPFVKSTCHSTVVPTAPVPPDLRIVAPVWFTMVPVADEPRMKPAPSSLKSIRPPERFVSKLVVRL